jgi:DNA (cytosine-5)-methyltransferase 1
MYKIGSLFSGIGGFELGLERAIPHSKTIWQVEQDKFCQSILKKHWPKAQIYNDVRNITKENVEPVDILCGGFPCQNISRCADMKGVQGEKSGLWWEMWRIISELSEGRKKPIVVLENVSNILRVGGREVLGSIAALGYDAEWGIVPASSLGANHRRKRWFAICYASNTNTGPKKRPIQARRKKFKNGSFGTSWNHWKSSTIEPPFCNLDDGIPDRVARLKALGNAIVPQCSQWIGEQIWKSGILQGENNV